MAAPPRYLSITELVKLFNHVFEEQIGGVPFEGEISQPTISSNGHLYFTIKDADTQLSAVMWRSSLSALTFKPVQGVLVQCFGRPSIYAKNGRFQIVVQRMQPAGQGELQRRFLELQKRLGAEGIFAPERKRPLPFLPRAVGLVTSSSGAVVHDFMVRVRERMPNLRVYLIDVKVQGPGAAEEITAAIDRFSASGVVDVVVVARGGGSLEDLWAFNEECVVRAIYRSRAPVISGVGHEVDVTLSDLAADVRAPTPTAAAEIVVPRRADLLRQIDGLQARLDDLDRWFAPRAQEFDLLYTRLIRAAGATLQRSALRLGTAEVHLRAIHPARLIALLSQRLAGARARLHTAASRELHQGAQRLQRGLQRLERVAPRDRLILGRLAVERSRERLSSAVSSGLRDAQSKVTTLSARLTAMSPASVLARGYALVEAGGVVVRSSSQLQPGDPFSVRLHKGSVDGKVVGTHQDSEIEDNR